ncbi:MAG: FCD domain-containing protein [Chitinophagaceae bacterium]|nr:FCD domain-containing protein [Rubrivivax sp.]
MPRSTRRWPTCRVNASSARSPASSRLRRLLEYRGYRDLARTRASLGEHLGMVDALLQGRQEEASALMRTHLTSAIQRRLGAG